jgi:DNA-binding protein H-NS
MSNELNYNELLAQRAELDNKIQAAQVARRNEGLAVIHEAMKQYGLTLEDLGSRTRAAAAPKTIRPPVAAKYRDPATGKEWTGRGKAPLWIADKNREDFLIR